MRTTRMKLVTIVAEPVLEDRLIDEIKKLGASGYTVTTARGEGTRGVHADAWLGHNARIEVVTSPELADRILEHLAHDYFRDYAVIAYTTDVDVVRGDKYR